MRNLFHARLAGRFSVMVCCLLLAGCAPTSTPTAPAKPTPVMSTAIPATARPVQASPVATPTASPLNSPIPPSANDPISPGGRVVGRAVQPAGRQGHPSFTVSGELYLGMLVPANTPNMPPAVAVSPSDAPHAYIDQSTGKFTFSHVPAGTYALVLIGFSDSYVFEKPSGGRVEVTVTEGKAIDLGDVTLR